MLLIEPVLCGLSLYLFSHVIIAMRTMRPVACFLSMLILVIAGASLIPAVFECFVKRPGRSASGSLRLGLAHRLRFLPPHVFRNRWVIVAYITCWVSLFMFMVYQIYLIHPSPQVDSWRLTFERFTSIPSGVSPVFPALFLAIAFIAAARFELTSRRSYRMSYIPSKERKPEKGSIPTHFERILISMRTARLGVDRRLYKFWEIRNVSRSNRILLCACMLLLLHIFIRSVVYQNMPHSLEARAFDPIFWSFFMIAFVFVLFRTLQLSSLWRQIKEMLRLAVELPLSPAYERIPSRFKGWFFGDEDFEVRDELIQQQSTAVRVRCSSDVAEILHEVELFSRDVQQAQPFLCRPTITPEETQKLDEQAQAFAKESTWHAELLNMRNVLKNSDTLHSTRTVYAFLGPLWESQPVENVPGHSESDAKKTESRDWLDSWPLTPWQRQKLKSDEKLASCATGQERPRIWSPFRLFAGSRGPVKSGPDDAIPRSGFALSAPRRHVISV